MVQQLPGAPLNPVRAAENNCKSDIQQVPGGSPTSRTWAPTETPPSRGS